jgi:hypothetical protein
MFNVGRVRRSQYPPRLADEVHRLVHGVVVFLQHSLRILGPGGNAQIITGGWRRLNKKNNGL